MSPMMFRLRDMDGRILEIFRNEDEIPQQSWLHRLIFGKRWVQRSWSIHFHDPTIEGIVDDLVGIVEVKL